MNNGSVTFIYKGKYYSLFRHATSSYRNTGTIFCIYSRGYNITLV